MDNLSSIPYAAVGAAARAARSIGNRVDDVRREVSSTADGFLSRSAAEGRKVVAKVPTAARLLGAANASAQPVTDVVGIDARIGAKLKRAGVSSVTDLWTHAGDRKGRSDLSGVTGIPADSLEGWAKRADLMRVKDIGPRYAALLESAGVTSLKQLRRRSAGSLHEALLEANRKGKIVESVPPEATVADWIEKAGLIAD